MFDEYEIYCIFRKCQSKFLSRPYRLPKDWNKHLNKTMTKANKEFLEKAVRSFNTIWQNIDPERMFDYGFELFGKSFTYGKIFDRKLIEYYKQKDKILKRETISLKKSIVDSAKFIKKFLKDNNIKTEKISAVFQYCNMKEGNVTFPLLHYIRGNINREVIIWFVKKGYLRISEEEKALIPYVFVDYRKTLADLEAIEDFMIKFERTLTNAKSGAGN